MATMLEAGPLIEALGLELLYASPYAVYSGARLKLIVSGIGKAHAAAATAHLIEGHQPALVISLGVAGSLNDSFALGEICQAMAACEPDRIEVLSGRMPEFMFTSLCDFRRVRLATMDKPASTPTERAALADLAELIDMEGAAVAQTAATYGLSCGLIKIVSDTPAEPNILKNLRQHAIVPGAVDSLRAFLTEQAAKL